MTKFLGSFLALTLLASCGGTAGGPPAPPPTASPAPPPTASYEVAALKAGETISFGGQKAYVEDIASDGSSITLVAFLDGFASPADGASDARVTSALELTVAKLVLGRNTSGSYVLKTKSFELTYEESSGKLYWTLQDNVNLATLISEVEAVGIETFSLIGNKLELPDSDGDGRPDVSEDSSTVVSDPNPMKIDLSEYSNASELKLTELGVGKGYLFQSADPDLAEINGTTITRTVGTDKNKSTYLLYLNYAPDSDFNVMALIDAQNLDAYIDTMLASNHSNMVEEYGIVEGKALGSSGYTYTLSGREDKDGGLKAISYGLSIVDASEKYVAAIVRQRLYRDDAEIARASALVRAKKNFNVPNGIFIYKGDAFIGGSANKLVHGDATLTVDFTNSSGSLEAKQLSSEDTQTTGSLTGTFKVNPNNGVLSGEAQGRVDTVVESGTLIGSFSKSADLAVGVADFDRLEGTFIVARE